MEDNLEYLRHEDIDYSDENIIDRLPYTVRRSPIMVTIVDPKMSWVDLQKIMEIGVNCIKFNALHSTTGEMIKLLKQLEQALSFLSQKHGTLEWPVSICIQLRTCIIKTGELEGKRRSIYIKAGEMCVLHCNIDLNECNVHSIFIENPYLAIDIKAGMLISLGQGEIEMQCKKIIDETSILCKVIKSGYLTSKSIVAMRGGEHKLRPTISNKDLQLVQFALEYQLDVILINYCRTTQVIQQVKTCMGKKVRRPLIFVGLCTPEGINNIDALIKEADGIVFSREFLVFELDDIAQCRLLQLQKMVGAKCLQAGKPFFISGEVFGQALSKGEFEDSETADITNAVLDGATGFVLKDCAEIERLLEVILAMNDLCCSVEPLTNSKTDFWRILDGIRIPANAADACAISCAAVAHQSRARIIVIPTVTGQTLKAFLRLRPACIVITVSTKKTTTRRLQLYRSVVPLLFIGEQYRNWYKSVQARLDFAVEYAVMKGWLKMGDNYVTLQRGSEDSAYCDMVRHWQVTIAQKTRVECADENDIEHYPKPSSTETRQHHIMKTPK